MVEAEAFDDYGGWVLDQQFMDTMGSPYLLAHGLGRPVRDATTTVLLPRAGRYRVWVRTFDWVTPWGAEGSPGAFSLLCNGTPLPVIFGTEGDRWGWQEGGTVDLPAGAVSLALRDRTGFGGRCDCILLTTDQALVPPENPAVLRAWRRACRGLPEEAQSGGSFDLVVVGGGVAGMCAAVSAARSGLRVALVHDRPVFGGNNSSEVRVWLGGETNLDPYPRLGDLVRELEPAHRAHGGPTNTAEIYEDERRVAWLAQEPNLALFPLYHLIAAETGPDAIAAAVVEQVQSGQRLRLAARLFADCTGDGTLGALAGADSDTTLTGHLGASNLWYVTDTGRPVPFPRCPWALPLADKPFPGRGEHTAQWAQPGLDSLGRWYWESGFDDDPIADAERTRDANLRAMYGAWDVLKNVEGLYSTYQLAWASYILGKRESRRLLGDVVVSRGDLYRPGRYADGCVPCTWHMDLHVPHRDYQPGFEGEEFISWCLAVQYPRPLWLPFRALYSRNRSNLLMAGRNVSVTHEALGTVRVMRTTGMMGEVVGLAAALCARGEITPRELVTQHWPALRQALRAGVPGKLEESAPAAP